MIWGAMPVGFVVLLGALKKQTRIRARADAVVAVRLANRPRVIDQPFDSDPPTWLSEPYCVNAMLECLLGVSHAIGILVAPLSPAAHQQAIEMSPENEDVLRRMAECCWPSGNHVYRHVCSQTVVADIG